MKLFFDFFPILLFFITYKFYGIYIATGVAIIASFGQVGFHWFKHQRFDNMQLTTLALIVVLGGATLLFHNEMFIKWKPTAINWIFGIIFLGSHFIGGKPIVQRMLEPQLDLPSFVWLRLNISWVLFFALMGMINLYVIYNFDTDVWVNFKLFGMLGLTLLFAILQAVYLSYLTRQPHTEKQKQ